MAYYKIPFIKLGSLSSLYQTTNQGELINGQVVVDPRIFEQEFWLNQQNDPKLKKQIFDLGWNHQAGSLCLAPRTP